MFWWSGTIRNHGLESLPEMKKAMTAPMITQAAETSRTTPEKIKRSRKKVNQGDGGADRMEKLQVDKAPTRDPPESSTAQPKVIAAGTSEPRLLDLGDLGGGGGSQLAGRWLTLNVCESQRR